MDKRVDWSDLPKELWPLIAKHLNATIDVLRFRSVCKTWRSSLPLHPSQTLFAPQLRIPHAKFSILQTKIYRLQPSLSPSSSNSKGWIIMVGESKSIPLRLLNPFTNFPLSRKTSPPKVLNLVNFRVVDLIQAYTLTSNIYIRKVMLFPSFHVEGGMVFALYNDGKLGVSNIGDQNWTFLDDENQRYGDIILRKGQLYVVDKWGTIFWINGSSLKLFQFSPSLYALGKRKHLVECGGSLYVVDLYVEGVPSYLRAEGIYEFEVVDIKVYKLDEEWGKWLDVKNLGDVVFVLGKDSNFSLSAQDYHGCEGNSIYFYAEGRACGFNLENSKFKSPKPFWPCPNLFHPEFNV